MATVSMEKLVLALSQTLGRKGMRDEEIQELAEYLLSFFGFENEFIDNRLTSEDRDVFYMLEEEGILKTTQEQVSLKRGKTWRVHYWVLSGERIEELAEREEEPEKSRDEMKGLYEDIDEDVWSRRD